MHPSRWEAGVPFSVLEAAALERPCLIGTAADPGGMLRKTGAAISVAPTVEALAAGLCQIRTMSPDALRAMGCRAREVVAAKFSWSRSAEIIVDAYRKHALGYHE